MNKIAVTTGDFNGIGPEIIIKALNRFGLNEEAGAKGGLSRERVVIIGNAKVFDYYEKTFGLKFIRNYEIVEIPYDENDLSFGKDCAKSGEFSYKCLEKACEMAKNREITGIVTAPVSKNTLNMAGYKFSGQTEILQKFLGGVEGGLSCKKAEMLFVAKDLRILLLTRHMPLNDVDKVITTDLIEEKVIRIENILRDDFEIKKPKIALLSVNPHAGEGGILGTSEQLKIIPAINKLRAQNIDISGPFCADSLFAKVAKCYNTQQSQPFDCYIAMYHDQGLIPIKMLAMDECVNMTVGLDIIRTSPAHGTAYDIAGKNLANENSMVEALRFFFPN